MAKTTTTLATTMLANKQISATQSVLTIQVHNTGSLPAFMTTVNISGTKRAIVASHNFEWLAPNERKTIALDVLWREPATRSQAVLTVSAWNAKPVDVLPATR